MLVGIALAFSACGGGGDGSSVRDSGILKLSADSTQEVQVSRPPGDLDEEGLPTPWPRRSTDSTRPR